MTRAQNKPAQAAFDADKVRAIAEQLKRLDGPLLPILHAVSAQFGYVDQRALPVIAEVLNLTRAEVHGVVTFYHDFRNQPAGRQVLKICRAEACQAMGCEALIAALETALQVKLGETSAGARVTLEPVYCLGNCALSPAALIDGKLLGRLDLAKVMAQVRR